MSDDLASEVARLRRRLERERLTRLEAEAVAERGLRELYVRQQQLQLLEAIAVAANETASVEDALRFAITQVCEYTGWPLGHAYIVAEHSDSLRLLPTSIWHFRDAQRFSEFVTTSAHLDISSGIGLPERVLATRSAVWIADVTIDENFPRAGAARACGLRAGAAFPVLAGSEVAAVLEFFSNAALVSDDTLLRLMSQIGTQIGRVLERRRAHNLLIDASHDPLTGLPNRALFMERLRLAVNGGKHDPNFLFAVLFVDLDNFKTVNDSLGHHAGDNLIVQVAGRLRSALRHEEPSATGDTLSHDGKDMLARLGGDEFIVLLAGLNDLNDALRVAQRMQSALTVPFSVTKHDVYAGASIGIATNCAGHVSADDILRNADLAMYRAKSLGKARVEVYDQALHATAVKRLQLESDLRRALREHEFELHYQPIVALDTTRIVGFEALVRWRRSELELINPIEFIGVAEETGLILPLGLSVLKEACQTMRSWHDEFQAETLLTISVNISPKQFAQPDLVAQIRQTIGETGIDPRAVRLEITESVAMIDAERTFAILSSLRELGVRITLDDFGTGFSCLSYLHRFPLDGLKIDRSFVNELDASVQGHQIVQTILSLGNNLDLGVVAEGIETPEQAAHLEALGCELGQGYLFSRPVDAVAARILLKASLQAASSAAAARATSAYPPVLQPPHGFKLATDEIDATPGCRRSWAPVRFPGRN